MTIILKIINNVKGGWNEMGSSTCMYIAKVNGKYEIVKNDNATYFR